jgi:hypothetical protein
VGVAAVAAVAAAGEKEAVALAEVCARESADELGGAVVGASWESRGSDVSWADGRPSSS